MQKERRQELLLKIIAEEQITSQAELAERLGSRGIGVTQASVSRDLEELGVIKVTGHYRLPNNGDGAKLFGLVSLETSGDSLIVARCEPGLASAVAVRIDAMRLPEIAGTIAGDDTIFIAVKDASSRRFAMRKIWELFDNKGGAK